MKTIKYCILACLLVFCLGACNEGIDPITSVAPGEDKAAPMVKITYPTDGLELVIMQEVVPITIIAEASDDIELASVAITLNGTELAKYTTFKDYRRYVIEYLYETLADGKYDLSVTATDMTGKSDNVSVSFSKSSRYQPLYDGEIFYMPFSQNFNDLVSEKEASKVGSPQFSSGISGMGYKGVTNAYIQFPAQGLLNNEFSAAFWFKLNSTPNRAGILTIGPPLLDDGGNDMTTGFRFFREAGGNGQVFKLNVGNGSGGEWFDGGATASVANESGWVHLAFALSQTEATVYLNGEIVSTGSSQGVKWDNVVSHITIMSGAPTFTGWDHFSDESEMDELRIFNKALGQGEVRTIMNATK